MTIWEVRLSIFCFRCSVSLWNSWSGLFWFALFTYWKGIVSTGVPLAFDAVTQVLLFVFFFLFKCEHKSFAFLFSRRGRWRDLLQSRRHNLQHRDDWRGLVEGTVSRTYRSVPGRLRSADRVSNTLPKSIFAQASLKLQYCWKGGGICI